jgi:hypothetical protein
VKYALALLIAGWVTTASAQSGAFVDLVQGFRIPSETAPYIGGIRSGYSTVLETRTSMSSSWRLFLDIPTVGFYWANPGYTVNLGAQIHQFLFEGIELGLPLFKTIAFYLFLEPAGYSFKVGEKATIGESWYSFGGLEVGSGGVFIVVSAQYLHRHKIWMPQAGIRVYTY